MKSTISMSVGLPIFFCDTVASEPMLYKIMLYHSVLYRINAATYLIIILVLFLVIAPSPQ